MKLTDVIEPQVRFTKSGKNQIEGLPSQFTSEDQILNAILNLDLPLTDKIGLLGQYEMNKGRKRIEYDDQELFVGKGGSDSKKIGIRYGDSDDEGLTGSIMLDPDTKDYSAFIKFLKRFAKGGRVNYQDGTEYNEDSKEKLKDLATKAVGKFDEITGVDQITSANFPGSFDAATGAPSDFRHQAASNLVAEALGKGKFGSLGYLSGGIGSFGLGTVKEIGDLVSGILDPNTSVKDAFSQAYEDTVSNFKGAFAPTGTTTEELYEKLLGDYEVKPNFAFDPFMMNLKADRARQIEDARKRALENIKNQRDSKPTTTVTRTTKPGTPGGRDTKPTTTVTGTTKPGTSGGFQKQERQTAREDRRGGQYGFASGGLARMLGE